MDSRDYSKEFRKVFDGLCRRHSWHTVFQDFMEMAACTMHQAPYHNRTLERDADFERVEQRYMEAQKRYQREELDQLAAMLGIAVMALQQEQQDFLGQLYMDLGVSNKHNGEFFTPSHVSRMMAMMSLQGVGETIREKGLVTIQEPACGAGVMLIEAANAIREAGFDPRYTMWFQAIDVNRTCVNMAYFQLSALGLCGEVVHGNSLLLEEWYALETPCWKIHRVAMQMPPRETLNDQKAAWLEKKMSEAPPPPAPKLKPQLAFDF